MASFEFSFAKHHLPVRLLGFDFPLILNFVEKNYKELKTLNPKLPILIRECSGTEPQMWARYDMGVERGVRLDGFTEAQILEALEELVKVGASLKA